MLKAVFRLQRISALCTPCLVLTTAHESSDLVATGRRLVKAASTAIHMVDGSMRSRSRIQTSLMAVSGRSPYSYRTARWRSTLAIRSPRFPTIRRPRSGLRVAPRNVLPA
ncbi:hypothetical protein OH76DRAFT_252118 [Lentinus brumalis]|uniref:Uncharacterized protein n=1 Tax=Lentinus brumalis TaxID=2498619 RepID=A0A371CLH1_9APHY|nr:hypothetical protein OH76DRAFT_252118 [Polyporus brumalis]